MKPNQCPSLSRVVAIAFAGLVAAACAPESNGVAGPIGGCDPLVTKANLTCGDPNVDAALRLLRAMSLEEKVQQMSGPTYNPNNMFDQLSNERLGIPGFLFMDGPRGVRWYNSDYGTTVYPVAAARGATWNLELERRIGKAMAQEMRYLGRHVLLAPTINQVSHPRWGRAQESYGEDSFLLGEMGRSFIAGAQYDPSVPDPLDPDQPIEDTYRVQACAKHFAANNLEDTRIFVNAVVDERTLREVYLPHFQKAVDAGVSCVMSSYNRVNGSYSGYSKDLVRDVLKGEWGYSGWVVSDWFAKGNTLTSPVAGLDIEMPFSEGSCPVIFDCTYFYGNRLVAAVRNGQVAESLVDEAVLRVLYRKVAFGVIDHAPPAWTPWLTKSDPTQALALEAAREGIVLLKNGPSKALADDVLPLDKAALTKIAVVGQFANRENMGDKGSSDAKVVDGSLVITPFEGIQEAFAGDGKAAVTYETVAGNEASLAAADVVVVVGAYFYADLARSPAGEEGEWKDRVSLQLPQRDLTNIADAVALKTRTGANPDLKVVVVAKSGGAIVVDPWIDGVDALVMAWYAGMKEGTALAEILFGDVNPSGKLVQSFPVAESDLPAFENKTTGDVPYDYYHGYRWLDRKGKAARYPFGYGLSYTTYAYSNLQVADPTVAADGTLSVSVDVTNTGPVTGTEVVQLYVGYDDTAVTSGWGRPKKELKAFARAENLAPGATQTVTLTVPASELGYWDTTSKKFVVEKMVHQLYVGPSADAGDPNTLKGTFTIE
ncbi:MAG TPA: glycoside hydrolase family 3 N-terminal domain-containing protein [Anaeromyxobacteraceae bacterium]|nr:glycoside hydrolase family 3 N-terminal domain-containing protein [Anaeromyxobacteraceae bacterium]